MFVGLSSRAGGRGSGAESESGIHNTAPGTCTKIPDTEVLGARFPDLARCLVLEAVAVVPVADTLSHF